MFLWNASKFCFFATFEAKKLIIIFVEYPAAIGIWIFPTPFFITIPRKTKIMPKLSKYTMSNLHWYAIVAYWKITPIPPKQCAFSMPVLHNYHWMHGKSNANDISHYRHRSSYRPNKTRWRKWFVTQNRIIR